MHRAKDRIPICPTPVGFWRMPATHKALIIQADIVAIQHQACDRHAEAAGVLMIGLYFPRNHTTRRNTNIACTVGQHKAVAILDPLRPDHNIVHDQVQIRIHSHHMTLCSGIRQKRLSHSLHQ